VSAFEPGSIASWAALIVTIALAAERAWSWVGSKKYTTREEVLAAADLGRQAHHRIDLVEERMKGLPGYATFNEMDDRVGKLLEGQAARREWEKGIEGQLTRIYVGLERLEQQLRHGVSRQ